jgi:hypothetical protein
MQERDLYRPVCDWLSAFLRQKHRSAQIWVEDTSRSSVAEFLRRHRLTAYVPWWVTLEIPVDVTGAVLIVNHRHRPTLRLAIVEVKVRPINLRDLSLAIGYAKVVQPDYAFLVSPNGWTENLQRLVRDYQRNGCVGICPEATPRYRPMGHSKSVGEERRCFSACWLTTSRPVSNQLN